MGIRLPSLLFSAKQILKTQSVSVQGQSNVPKGHIAVYVGEIQRKRFLVPISYLNHPSFVNLLSRAEEEFGFNHPTGGLTIPCRKTDIDFNAAVLSDRLCAGSIAISAEEMLSPLLSPPPFLTVSSLLQSPEIALIANWGWRYFNEPRSLRKKVISSTHWSDVFDRHTLGRSNSSFRMDKNF